MKPAADPSDMTDPGPRMRRLGAPATERGMRVRFSDVPDGLLDHMGRERATVRDDVVARARLRLVEGPRPSAADVADSLVQHLVSARGS